MLRPYYAPASSFAELKCQCGVKIAEFPTALYLLT